MNEQDLDEKLTRVRDAVRPAQSVDILTPEMRGDLINTLVYVERSMARMDLTDARTGRPRADLAKASEALRRVLGAPEPTQTNGIGGD